MKIQKETKLVYNLFIRFLKENNCYHSFMYLFNHRQKYIYSGGFMIDKNYTFIEYIQALNMYDIWHNPMERIIIYAFEWGLTYNVIKKNKIEAIHYWYNLSHEWSFYLKSIQDEIKKDKK